MKELNGVNGARIELNPAPFKTVKRLRQVLAKELLAHKIDIGNPKSLADLKKQVGNNVSEYVNLIKDVLLGLEVSDEFTSVIWDCLRHCLYNKIAINEQLFDDVPEAREDYDTIVVEVIKLNIAPFMKSLHGMFEMPNDENIDSQM